MSQDSDVQSSSSHEPSKVASSSLLELAHHVLQTTDSACEQIQRKQQTHVIGSLVPRPLPDFISQLWRKIGRKIGRKPGSKTVSQTGNGGLGLYKPSPRYVLYKPSPRYVLTESTISGPWRSFAPRPSPDFSPQLRNKIWEGPGDEATSLGGKFWIFST